MAKYNTDLQDIEFNLFKELKVQEHYPEYGENDLKDILIQFDKFNENEIFSVREEGDEHGVSLTQEGVKVPKGFHRANEQFYQNGWFALGFEEKYGGMPVPETIHTQCISLLCGANVSYSMYPGLSVSCLHAIHQAGTEDQINKFTAPMIEGRWGGTMCLTEAGAGSGVGALRTTATPIGDGTYKIKRVKIFISSGESDLYENNIHLVLARTPEGEPGTKGISLFIVPRYRINDDGTSGASNDVKCTKIEEKMGLHGQATCELTFGTNDDCIGELIGKEFEGMKNMFIMMNEARLLCGVQGEGQANLAYEMTKQYVTERSQFGTEIINHPDVKRMMLKMRAMTRGLRSLILYTANLFDIEKKNPGSAIKEIEILTPVCKAYCSDEGFNVAVDAIQVHGGYGYCTEYGIEQFARDIKIATIYEGTNGIQAIDFIHRKILKDQAKTFFAVGTKISETLRTDEAREFNEERRLLIENQFKIEDILKNLSAYAQKGDFNHVLQHATDFLTFSGNLVVAWRLLDMACLAKKEMNNNPDPEYKKYLESKVIDFKVFCQHYLVRNFAISKTILEFEQNVSTMDL